ncbi:MAG TPA: extracellular solute-binding protein [Chloroflexota bacterium]|nr:extracellular solute-binding protein [Chloroflexota bacterium]
MLMTRFHTIRSARTRRMVLGSLSGAAAALLAACGMGTSTGSGGEAQAAKVTQQTTLVYWTNLSGADGATMKELAERYQKETPLVTVEQIQGVNPYFDKVLSAAAAGTPPDVLGTRMPYVPFLAEQGVIADLSPRELQQLGLQAGDFEPAVWKSGEWKGKRYSIPMDLNGHMLLYNETAVRDLGGDPSKPPSTWQDWLDWSTRLTKNETHGTAYDFAGEGLVVMFMHHLHQQGGKVFDTASAAGASGGTGGGKKVAFNTPKGVAALQLLSDITQRANLPVKGGTPIELFEQRKLPTWLNGPWNLNRLARPENPAFNDLRSALAPQFDPKRPAWMAQGFQLTLPKQPKPDEAKRTAAFSLVNYLFNKGFEWSLAGKLPVSKKVLASEQFQKSADPIVKHLRLWEKYLPNATLIESHPRWVDAINALHPELTKAITRQSSPQTAIQEAERAVNAALGS